MPATCTCAFTVFTPRANVKDAAAEHFKSRRCETITMSHSEIAVYALLKKNPTIHYLVERLEVPSTPHSLLGQFLAVLTTAMVTHVHINTCNTLTIQHLNVSMQLLTNIL